MQYNTNPERRFVNKEMPLLLISIGFLVFIFLFTIASAEPYTAKVIGIKDGDYIAIVDLQCSS